MATRRDWRLVCLVFLVWLGAGCGASSNDGSLDSAGAVDARADLSRSDTGTAGDTSVLADLSEGADGVLPNDTASKEDGSTSTSDFSANDDTGSTADTSLSDDTASPTDTAVTSDGVTADLGGLPDLMNPVDIDQPDTAAGLWTTGTVGSIGTPFDYATGDNNGPAGHTTIYGARPTIAIVVNPDGSLDVAWQDTAGKRVVITRLSKVTDQLTPTGHLTPTGLELLGGFTKDPSGNLYLMTAANESLQTKPTPADVQRADIVTVAKYDPMGNEIFATDLRTDINGADNTAIYDPLTAGTGRLLFAGGLLMTSFSQHGEYDAQVSSRHQWHINIGLDATSGALKSYYWGISHSFDQRLLHDGTNFISVALGDASLRGIGVSKIGKGGFKVAFAIKGGDSATGGGYNNTFTRLGNLRVAQNGYLLLFATENDPSSTGSALIAPRNLAIVHIAKGFDSIAQGADGKYDVTIVDTADQNSDATTLEITIKDYWGASFVGKNRGLVWLTGYADKDTENAERPKLVPLANNQFLVLWEKWSASAYVETYAMVIGEYGNVVKAATAIGSYRLYRGDDLVAYDGAAAWLIGDGKNKRFRFVSVDANLDVTSYLID
ncbi:MAG: hypothetical protein KC609_19850 [Myxococcales bacterium]|nr:hypothetical protein [Myxococcales bacterium]